MSDLASKLFKALRQMDSEANVDRNGHPTGLNWYGGDARPELKRPQTEPEWTKRLAKILPAMGLPTKAEARYPGLPAGRLNRCDLVITESDGGRLWLEIKGAWTTYWVHKGSEGIYRAYLFHPVLPDLPPKSHTAALDVKKLSALTPSDAQAVGLLLIGFDSISVPMSGDVGELARLVRLDTAPWRLWSDTWEDPWRPDCSVRCWLWRRPV